MSGTVIVSEVPASVSVTVTVILMARDHTPRRQRSRKPAMMPASQAALYDLVDLAVKLAGLKRARELAALTQQQLAEKAHVTRGHLSLIERQRSPVYPSTLRKLADALAVEPSVLVMQPER